MNDLTHFSDSGRARMVDVSDKSSTQRVAIASGILRMQPATLERIRAGRMAKGDVLTVADVGAVMAAKRTPDIIPMCHSLALAGVDVAFSEVDADDQGRVGIRVVTTTSCVGPTGVEMEALCAAGVALLTIGQYLAPSPTHHPVARFVPPAEFDRWRDEALALGFACVAAAPHVRSSYHAEELAAAGSAP